MKRRWFARDRRGLGRRLASALAAVLLALGQVPAGAAESCS